jgi:21S rRNA (GM2251-2'-O)-methyltransferase
MSRPEVRGVVLFGLFPVALALQQGRRTLHRVYIREGQKDEPKPMTKAILKTAASKSVEVVECSPAELNALSQARPHQVIIKLRGVFSYKQYFLFSGCVLGCQSI